MENKKVFSVNVDGKDIKIEVRRPDVKVNQEAQIVYSAAFKNAVTKGCIVKKALKKVLTDQGLWNDQMESEWEDTRRRYFANEKKLAEGGKLKSEGYKIALQMRRDRARLQELNRDLNALDLTTAEAIATEAKFNFLVSKCTVRGDTGKPYFKDEDDYLGRPDSDPVAGKAAELFGQLAFGVDPNYLAKEPENKFLKQFGYCDDQFRLVNEQGKLVDEEGNLVDEYGNRVDESGQIIDVNGNPINPDGTYIVESKPWLDDNGNPIGVTTEVPASVAL